MIHKINNQFAFLFDIPKSFSPITFHEDRLIKSLTVIPIDSDIFQLNPPHGGCFTEPIFGSFKKEGKGLIIRVPVGYTKMIQIEKDFTLGCLVISHLINSMLSIAYKYRKNDFDQFKTLTFDRPGMKNSFFQEMESSAGFQLRLFVEF